MKHIRWISLLVLMTSQALAQVVTITGNMEISIPRSSSGGLKSAAQVNSMSTRRITLLRVELSPHARQVIEDRAQAIPAIAETSASGTRVQLGMGNVPVLDQGSYGACVTFANTAAIDAVLNKGDYISQLCPLQLGRYLEQNAYIPSGWDGSSGGVVLGQLNMFGIVSKAKQQANGCGGVTVYPSTATESLPGMAMTPTDYHQISESMSDDLVGWSSIVDVYQVFLDNTQPSDILSQVKAALNAGDRLTFGLLLPDIHKGIAGAVGRYHVTNDSWLLTPEIVADMTSQTELPGHEMVITGYDDAAVAVDDHGRTHTGLLTIRNSWGANVGDKGNFYMSYDYFKTLLLEVQRIRKLQP